MKRGDPALLPGPLFCTSYTHMCYFPYSSFGVIRETLPCTVN